VTDGPFTETKELIAGFWMIEVTSKDEAIEWAKRVPFSDGEVIEIRQVFEPSDFPPEVLPPEDAAREQAWRQEQERKHPMATAGLFPGPFAVGHETVADVVAIGPDAT
jgi:hypothetical protein